MEEVQREDEELHPFEQFRVAMTKLLAVPKSEIDEKLRQHNETKLKRRAGRKPTARRKA